MNKFFCVFALFIGISACDFIGVDEGYDEAISAIKIGLKYKLYDRKDKFVIKSGFLSPEFIECIKNSKRMYNVGSYKGSKSNMLWFENEYGMKLFSINGSIYRYSFFKKNKVGYLLISEVYTVTCNENLL